MLGAILPRFDSRSLASNKAVNYKTETANVEKRALQSCVDLLSSDDMDQNRVGLQRLLLLTKRRHVVSSNPPIDQPSYAIIFGGSEDSICGSLRSAFLPFLCDVVEEYDDDDDDIIESDDVDEETPMGKHWGTLHHLALRVLVNALQQTGGFCVH